MKRPTILLVHGAWCGEWVFWKLKPCLDERGLRWVGADLPSCRAVDTSVGPLDDVEYVRGLITAIDGPVVVVGKSYGGTVISGASAGCSTVMHLVYVAAMMPAVDERFQTTTAAARTEEFSRAGRMLDDGRIALDPEVGPGWEEIPSTYIVCTEDKAIRPSAERAWAERATNVIERPWDHSPGVSHPNDVADLLAQVVNS